MISAADITGVILCGGRAQRMNGVEKGLQLLDGLPLIAHVQRRLQPQVARIVVSANRELERYAVFGDGVFPDTLAGIGPVGGILSALVKVHSPYLFVCPCDAPYLATDLVALLANMLDRHPAAGACIPFDGVRAQQLFMLLRSSDMSQVKQYIESGGRSVHGLVDVLQAVTVDASTVSESFVNINTFVELNSASRAPVVNDAHDPATRHSSALERL